MPKQIHDSETRLDKCLVGVVAIHFLV